MSTEVYYTGVGSRKTPMSSLCVLRDYAKHLAARGIVLRSGGADGADTFFLHGACGAWLYKKSGYTSSEIYLPWSGFGEILDNEHLYNIEPPYRLHPLERIEPELVTEAQYIAKHIHPAWNKLSEAGKKLHTRNVFQVLGRDLKTPSSFLICYAETSNKKASGTPIGGTRTAWCIAKERNIECFNLAFSSERNNLDRFLDFFL